MLHLIIVLIPTEKLRHLPPGHTLTAQSPFTEWPIYSLILTGRFTADNLNKAKNLCSKSIGEKMKVQRHLDIDFISCIAEWERSNDTHILLSTN